VERSAAGAQAGEAPSDARARSHARVTGYACAALYCLQFVLEDAAFRGPRAWLERPRLFVDLASSAVTWLLVLVAVVAVSGRRERRAARAVAAGLAAAVLVAQALVFRYYHAPLDVQVAASALFSWHDVRGVMMRALPGLALATGLVAAAEYALLAHVRVTIASSGLPRPNVALGLAALGGLLGEGPRRATPEVRAVHALSALRSRSAPASGAAVSLPPLHSERPLPSVLVVLTESVRASDYVAGGDTPTAPETAKVTRGRFELSQMRAISSYTAVSLSALLTARSQEGPRDAILRAPGLFDFAHAARDARGAAPFVAYFSAQSETVFEAPHVRAAVDRFVTVETTRGHDVEDDADYAELPLDRDVVDRFVADLPSLPLPTVTMLHLVGTHAPYFVDPARAPFQPFDHVVTWSRMPKLHAAYKDAIYEQDRLVARAVSAFVDHARGRPWLVVFTSDHGEAFGENGAIHHGQNLMDEQVHVPAWIAASEGALAPSEARALTENGARFVTHLDVLPTVLDAMGLWDNFAVAPFRREMPGQSLLRAREPREPLPVTNCTHMFPCPVNTWGFYADDRKLVARIWDPGWACLALGPAGERAAPPGDPACERLRAASRKTFPLLPNGAPNR